VTVLGTVLDRIEISVFEQENQDSLAFARKRKTMIVNPPKNRAFCRSQLLPLIFSTKMSSFNIFAFQSIDESEGCEESQNNSE
jgi:hypothetical protein